MRTRTKLVAWVVAVAVAAVIGWAMASVFVALSGTLVPPDSAAGDSPRDAIVVAIAYGLWLAPVLGAGIVARRLLRDGDD
jgi:hypothetical protein